MNYIDIAKNISELYPRQISENPVPVNFPNLPGQQNFSDENFFNTIVRGLNTEANRYNAHINDMKISHNEMMINANKKDLSDLLIKTETEQLNSVLIGKIGGKISQAFEKVLNQS